MISRENNCLKNRFNDLKGKFNVLCA